MKNNIIKFPQKSEVEKQKRTLENQREVIMKQREEIEKMKKHFNGKSYVKDGIESDF